MIFFSIFIIPLVYYIIKIKSKQSIVTINQNITFVSHIDSLDWKENATAHTIAERVISKAHDGAIVLFHNDADFTPAALPTILKTLKEQGYEFVFINDLILKENYTIDHAGKQCAKKDGQ